MKLCTFEYEGISRVGIVVDENTVADATATCAAYLIKQGETKVRAFESANLSVPASLGGIINGGVDSLKIISEAKEHLKTSSGLEESIGTKLFFPLAEVILKAPIARPPKMLACVYNRISSYGRATKPLPHHPYYFVKLGTCIIGPDDRIEIPGDVGMVGPELEVAAIIGKKGKNIPIEDAAEYIFGYTIVNDITAHEMRRKSEWIITKQPSGEEERLTYPVRYKNFDTWAPMGPWVVTHDEIPDIYNCRMEARVNNVPVLQGNLADMNFRFPELISYFSSAHTMEPGDAIFSGSCSPAAGWKMNSIDLRKLGGILESEVEGIGVLRNPIAPV